MQKLQEPLTASACDGISKYCNRYALCVHDWSHLSYKHRNKSDTYEITHKTDIGYDLQTSLIVSDISGLPIAPVAQRLVSIDGSYATYDKSSLPTLPVKHHLDEVSDCIEYLDQQNFGKQLVHMIDREGDSIKHIRQWETYPSLWLVRAKDNPKVDYDGNSLNCKAVAQALTFTQTRQVNYHGKIYWQWVAETIVTLSRPAIPSRKKAPNKPVIGVPVQAKLVVSRVISDEGEILAEWLLLTNVMDENAATVALWYYWRWKIESFFKLLKSAGHHLESWQQESASAIAKRLLVTSMACVTIWEIAADNSEEAIELKRFLVKLSGRQMRHKTEFTNPSLLAGL